MKRLIWGIVVVVFGVLFLVSAGNNPQGPAGSIALGILCLPAGGALIYFGANHLKARSRVGEVALAMLREDSKIDAGSVAKRLQMKETTVRELIADLQRRNSIPIKAELV